MSRRRWPWKQLGLDPTDDVSAIRRAYATKLRAMDPDQDPEAFMALRDARDGAMAQAASLGEEEPGDPLFPTGESGEEAELLAHDADVRTVSPLHDGPDPDLHFRSLAQLLLTQPPREQPLDEAEAAEALHHLHQILADPRLAEVGFYADAEHWLAEILASSVPWSDPLLDAAARHFGWDETAGTVNQAPAVAFVTERLEELAFLEAVQSPRHEHHRAWRELTTPADESSRKGWGVGHRRVSALLHLVRGRFPGLESHFDWYRVALWESPPAFEFKGWWLGLVIILVMQVARCAANLTDPNPASRPQFTPPSYTSSYNGAPLVTPAADIDLVLDGMFGDDLNVAAVQAKNPELYQLLHSNWTVARDSRRSRAQFNRDLSTLLLDRYRAAIGTASYPILADHRRLLLDGAAAARQGGGWKGCVDVFTGVAPPPRSAALDARERALIARTLLDVTGPLSPPSAAERRFRVPGPVMEDVARRSGLAPAALRDALLDKGPAQARCQARTALIQAVLALPPKDGLELLRKL